MIAMGRSLQLAIVGEQMNIADGAASAMTPRRTVEIDTVAAMNLLATVSHGRVVFTDRALPAIRVVNHLVNDGDIIIRTSPSTALAKAVNGTIGTVVAYEADFFDAGRTGWSVVATGIALPVVDTVRVAAYLQELQPWVDGDDDIIALSPQIVTGFRWA